MSFHMEGQALTWFLNLEELGELTDWEALTRPKQGGFVEEDISKFKALSNQLKNYQIFTIVFVS